MRAVEDFDPSWDQDAIVAAQESHGGPAQRLLDEIDAEYGMTASLTGRERLDPRVRRAIESVPRHLFVPRIERTLAYLNQPLPIGHRQTISQPYIVALMTDLLELAPGDIVLEIGTGSGYQSAVLSSLARRVYSIEVIDALATTAATRLSDLGYDNVEVRSGDGASGWPEHAPFDGIIVTAAAPEIPPALIDQLAPGGRLVAPVGNEFRQTLVLVEKSNGGKMSERSILPVAFVPLTHGEDWPA